MPAMVSALRKHLPLKRACLASGKQGLESNCGAAAELNFTHALATLQASKKRRKTGAAARPSNPQ
jgi:hypothetical protein